MPDWKKVIKGLECCLASKYPPCGECGYYGDMHYNDPWSCRLSLMADALALLRQADAPTIDAVPVDWMLQRMNETASGAGLNVELNNALFMVGVEWERWKKEHAED